ncbi:MAG: tyrosine-type recombinase/integrase [Bacteroidales bacterium]
MSVKVRPYRRGGWEVDITTRLPNGTRRRERSRAPVSSKSAAVRWGEDREKHLLLHGPSQPRKEVPTLDQFAPRFLDGYARANRQKASGVAAKEMIVRVHLSPALGNRRLDTILNEDVQRLKHRLLKKAAKTVNNILTVLNVMLKKAVEWDVIERMPCTIKLLPVPKCSSRFYDYDEFERLVAAAKAMDPRAYLLVLLSGEAGLRLGEMVALEWGDIDFVKQQACVQRSAWKGQVASPKGGRLRYVPLTARLAAALRENRHLRGTLVLYQDDGAPLTEGLVQGFVRRAAQRAGLFNNGPHMLRHTFCSHLAMLGAPARAIQELAGHQDLITTQRYMHLSPAALGTAVQLLDQRRERGDILETGSGKTRKSRR